VVPTVPNCSFPRANAATVELPTMILKIPFQLSVSLRLYFSLTWHYGVIPMLIPVKIPPVRLDRLRVAIRLNRSTSPSLVPNRLTAARHCFIPSLHSILFSLFLSRHSLY
jgi:hypothetical protein